MATPERTIGQAVSGTDLPTAAMLAGFALVVIGSLGPWATAPLSSLSGVSGDGKWTVILAVIGAVQAVRKRKVSVGIACLAILGFGLYDAIHIHQVLARVTLFGAQIDHVGWGVYAVIVGALVALVPVLKGAGDAWIRRAPDGA